MYDKPLYVAGGHANFRIACGSANGGNCAGPWGGGLHIESERLTTGERIYWGHNDTASYYIGSHANWGTFSPWNLVVHGTVDFIYGHMGNYIFPY